MSGTKEDFLSELESLFSRYGISVAVGTEYVETLDDAFVASGDLSLHCLDFEVTEDELLSRFANT